MTPRSRTDRRADVVDQPGLRRSLPVLGVAILLGLGLRALLNSDALALQIERAGQRIHPTLELKFERAHVSLSHFGIPEIAAVVESVDFNFDQACSPLLQGRIDQIRLPLSGWALLQGKVEIREVDLESVRLKWGATRDCPQELKEASGADSDQSATDHRARADQKSMSESAAVPSNKADALSIPELPAAPRGGVEALSISSLLIEFESIPQLPLEIEDLELQRKKPEGAFYLIEGVLNLGSKSLSADYSSRARFKVDYSEGVSQILLDGSWREGVYRAEVEHRAASSELSLKGRIDNLPLSQILTVLQEAELLDREYDGRQLWLSAEFTSDGVKALRPFLPLRFESLQLQGDLGEIKGENLLVHVGDRTELQPGELRLRGIRPEALMTFLDQSPDLKSFGSLGQINGSLVFKDEKNWSFVGESSGLELVFSNRGQRALQPLSVVSGKIESKEGQWTLLIERVRPLEGLFLGSVRVDGGSARKRWDVEVLIEELSLAPDVQALMSLGGALGRWSGEVRLQLEEGQMTSAKGQVTGFGLSVGGLSVDRLRVGIAGDRTELDFDLRAQNLALQADSEAGRFFEPYLAQSGFSWNPNQIAPTGQMTLNMRSDQALRWNLKPVLLSGFELRSQGAWDSMGQTEGEVVFSQAGTERRWGLRGDREKPEFFAK